MIVGALPGSAMVLSAVCEYGISWSYSLTIFLTFPFCILGQVGYLIVLIPDHCCLSYFYCGFILLSDNDDLSDHRPFMCCNC